MSPEPLHVLAVNGGNSSARFALYEMGARERLLVSAVCEGIGLARGRSYALDEAGRVLHDSYAGVAGHEDAARKVADWLRASVEGLRIDVLGHRFVHGGRRFAKPVLMSPELEDELFSLIQLEPGHLEPDVRLARAVGGLFPGVPGVACFDTAFHRTMPAVAQMHPMPRELFDQGVVRFGAHGISLEYVMGQLAAEAGQDAALGRVVVAHLGCTASMTAVHDGRSLETTAGYMPNGGLMMGTRSGDLSPGVLLHLLIGKDMSALEVNRMVNFQSGLLGVSRVSRDMLELLKASETNPHAAEAVALFCYTAKKHMGSLAAVLGGIETLVFTGGVGANAPAVRRAICENMGHLGIRLDPARNRQNGAVVSAEKSPVTVRVIATNEELVIARAAARVARESLARA